MSTPSHTSNDAAAWTEYDNAADDMAKRGLKGEIGDPLPMNMTPEAVALINEDLEAFQERVRLSAYAQAMEKLSTPRE